MLSHLVIRNFAIIDHLEIPFYRGLTVLSGETGAGKSIVIDALNLVLGGRASTDIIRTDESQAVVEASFELDAFHQERVGLLLEELGIESVEGTLLIRRIISRNGRNKVFINGSLSTVSTLQDVTSGLVDISGQHEHYSLMQGEKHVELLDEFGVLHELRTRMGKDFARVRAVRREMRELRENVRERLHRIDFLKFQLEEIDSAELIHGEDVQLERDLRILKNAEKISDSTNKAGQLIYDGNKSAVSLLSDAARELERIADCDPTLEALHKRIVDAHYEIEDCARELFVFADGTDANPRSLDKVIGRLELLKKLKRKHGVDIDAILAEADDMRAELHRLENAEERGQELEEELQKAEQRAFKTAVKLSKERRDAALLLSREVETQLTDLNMARAQFIVGLGFETLPKSADEVTLTATGFDTIEFMISPNAGEAPKPLAKIASGGELSRVMLAIKTVLAERDSISTYVFDEVDSGIGGSTADMVGEKIAEAAKEHQVLCITHLPQIASRGTHHYVVEKETTDGRTQSSIRPLEEADRVEEIARMLGGSRTTDKTREAAQELLRLR